jgi:hypothetical protein
MRPSWEIRLSAMSRSARIFSRETMELTLSLLIDVVLVALDVHVARPDGDRPAEDLVDQLRGGAVRLETDPGDRTESQLELLRRPFQLGVADVECLLDLVGVEQDGGDGPAEDALQLLDETGLADVEHADGDRPPALGIDDAENDNVVLDAELVAQEPYRILVDRELIELGEAVG